MTPTVVSVIEKNFDISLFSNLSEEENNSKVKIDLKFLNCKSEESYILLLSKKDFFLHIDSFSVLKNDLTNPPPEVS
jgi:hypothetical protein